VKNTPYSITESTSLVKILIQKSVEKRIEWTEGEFDEGKTETYEAALEDGMSAAVSTDKSEIRFALTLTKHGVRRPLLAVALEHDPSFGYDSISESELYRKLVELLELARRSALQIDENLAHAREYLERLSG
jgi:hypothetical protein